MKKEKGDSMPDFGAFLDEADDMEDEDEDEKKKKKKKGMSQQRKRALVILLKNRMKSKK